MKTYSVKLKHLSQQREVLRCKQVNSNLKMSADDSNLEKSHLFINGLDPLQAHH